MTDTANGSAHGAEKSAANAEDLTQVRELAGLIVATLNLNISAAAIDPDAALFGDGLGLDSIDILEVALAISKTYGYKLRSDDEENGKIFSSLRNLNRHVQAHRMK